MDVGKIAFGYKFVKENITVQQQEKFTDTITYNAGGPFMDITKNASMKTGKYNLTCVSKGGVPSPDISIWKGQEKLVSGKQSVAIQTDLSSSTTALECRSNQVTKYQDDSQHILKFDTTISSGGNISACVLSLLCLHDEC